MYKIYCDNELIFDLSSDISLISPILKLQDNNAGTLEFSIVPDNIIYDKIKKMKSEIKVFSDGKPIFEGRPIDETVDFKNCKKVMCEGALAYLNDSIQRPAEYHNLSIRAYLETLIGYHNQQVSDDRLKFNVGIVTVNDDNDSIYKYTNWETTLQVIKTDLVDKYGGHLRVRVEGDTRYLDYLKDYPRTNTQVIEFGTNLLDFTKNIDATQIVTAVIPLGARLEESSIKKLEERVTIKSVNDNLDYIVSKAAVDTYGWIFKTVTWDNVHKPLILKHKAEEYLKSIQFEKVVLKVRAIDLHMVNVDIEQIHLLDEIRVISKPNGLDKVFPVSEMTIDMTNPQANTITLGQTVIQAMSGSAVSNNEEIKKKIDELPSVDEAVQEAVKNATEMLNNALNGHVVKRKDELLIMDTADLETAKKVWRWNLNGLAYSNNGYKGPYEMAMTMDGSIVANRITTGILKGGFVKFDLTRGTFLIGRNDQDFLLKFDGEKLQFGNGTLKKDALEKELLESLKGKDGKPGRDGRDGQRGAQGPPGRDGRDGSMVDLPPALKDWSGKATEISGKYVFTPELFVGTNKDSQYSRTGIYIGSGIRAKNLFGSYTDFTGLCGISNGLVLWNMRPDGAGWIGNADRMIQWNNKGEVKLPKIKADEIEAGAITTDMLYPGNNNRIVLERGYSPGDNNCMSVDTNVDSEGTKCLRLKVDAGTYLRLTKKAAFSLLSNGSQVFHFDPRQQYDLEFFGDRGRGIGKFNMYDAYLEAKCYIGQVARMGIVTYEMQWSTSDRRLKTDIEYLSQSMTSKLINFIKNVDIAEFYYKSDKEKDHKQISVIAQDIIKEFPDLK
ncbi:MAG: phage tail spike protein, partial [Peptostreptococcus anaerobius]